jgi:hypothetical protein
LLFEKDTCGSPFGSPLRAPELGSTRRAPRADPVGFLRYALGRRSHVLSPDQQPGRLRPPAAPGRYAPWPAPLSVCWEHMPLSMWRPRERPSGMARGRTGFRPGGRGSSPPRPSSPGIAAPWRSGSWHRFGARAEGTRTSTREKATDCKLPGLVTMTSRSDSR